jgi:hypothetical protein
MEKHGEIMKIAIVVLALFALVGCNKKDNKAQALPPIAAQASKPDPTAAFPRVKLMTQDENFNFLLKCAATCYEMEDKLVQYSPSWQKASKEANAAAVGFTDPALKAQAWQNKFAEVKNKFGGDEKFREEGTAAVKSQLAKYVKEHGNDLFELARFDKYVANREYLALTHLSIPFPTDAVHISLAEMDNALKRFRMVEVDSIDKTFIGLRREQPAVMRAFEEQGLRATPPSDEEERSIAEGIVLSERVSLAAKGDPVKPRIDELYLVDVPSGVVLTQLPTDSVKKAEPKDTPLARDSEGAPALDAERSIRQALDNWVQSFRNKDARAQADCYAPVVETYFRWHNVPREQLAHDKEKSFAAIGEIRKYEISEIQVSVQPAIGGPDSTTNYSRADAIFQKEWDTSTVAGKIFAGREIEKLTFVGSPEGWKIVGEQELKILQVVRQ